MLQQQKKENSIKRTIERLADWWGIVEEELMRMSGLIIALEINKYFNNKCIKFDWVTTV